MRSTRKPFTHLYHLSTMMSVATFNAQEESFAKVHSVQGDKGGVNRPYRNPINRPVRARRNHPRGTTPSVDTSLRTQSRSPTTLARNHHRASDRSIGVSTGVQEQHSIESNAFDTVTLSVRHGSIRPWRVTLTVNYLATRWQLWSQYMGPSRDQQSSSRTTQ